jgi:Holliday junction resolvasome RuvABC endonuclease subunit
VVGEDGIVYRVKFSTKIVEDIKSLTFQKNTNNIVRMNKYYIGIDPSFTCTGIALIIAADGQIIKEVTAFKSPKEEKPVRRIAAIRNYAQVYVCHMLEKHAPYLADLGNCGGSCIEGPAINSVGRNDDKGQLRGALKLWLHDDHLEAAQIPPKTLKKFGAFHGAASKDDMIKFARMAGWEIPEGQDDMADAAHLADMAYSIVNHRKLKLKRKQLDALNALGELK